MKLQWKTIYWNLIKDFKFVKAIFGWYRVVSKNVGNLLKINTSCAFISSMTLKHSFKIYRERIWMTLQSYKNLYTRVTSVLVYWLREAMLVWSLCLKYISWKMSMSSILKPLLKLKVRIKETTHHNRAISTLQLKLIAKMLKLMELTLLH